MPETTLAGVAERFERANRKTRERRAPESGAANVFASLWPLLHDFFAYWAWFFAGIAALRRDMDSGLTLVAVAVLFHGLRAFTTTPTQRAHKRLIAHGDVARAAIVQANELWFASDNDRSFPGVVVFTLDDALEHDPQRLTELAHALFELKTADRSRLDPEWRDLAWRLYCELGPFPPVRLPESFCGARDTFVADVDLPARPVRCEDGTLAVVVMRGRPTAGIAVISREE